MNLLGWDLEYVSGAALATFTDTIFIRRINDFLPDNDYPHILDCGANIGCTVLNYKRQFPNARITAFEPDPQFAPILRRNLANNNASDVEVVEAAVWTQDGEISWICEGVDGSRIVEDGSTSNMITVPTIDLVKYLQVSVDLLKLDIEGAEYAVVDHISHNLEKVKNIIVECHIQQSNLKDFGRLLGTLKKAGFRLSFNTIGAWRDLIRQIPVSDLHFEQYVAVYGWRVPITQADEKETILPYAGGRLFLEMEPIIKMRDQYLNMLRAFMFEDQNGLVKTSLASSFAPHGGFAWGTQLPSSIMQGDTSEKPENSTLLLFEDDIPLGPAHSIHDEIHSLGMGRFSHWYNYLYFSTSDGSDPNKNGRTYQILCLKSK